MREYYTISYLETQIKISKSSIYRSLLKYGYSNFSLEILEYCDPDKTLNREQAFLDLLQPPYNILKKAGSLLGFRHSEETIAKFKTRFLNAEQKAKHLEQLKIFNSSSEQIKHLKKLHSSKEHIEHLKRLNLSQRGRARPEGAGVPSVMLEVFDTETNVTTVYPSINEATRAIGVAPGNIHHAFKRQEEKGVNTIFIKKKRYRITKLIGD